MTGLVELRAPRKTGERGREKTAAELLKSIRRKVGQAIGDYPQMFEPNDRVMVCVSGGKDSYAMLDVVLDLRKRAPAPYSVLAVNIDQGWPNYDTDAIEAHLRGLDVEYKMIKENYAALVDARLRPGQTPCSLCSRFRRGVLYNLAQDFNCTKIALGHHADDLVETLLLNVFFSGRLASMPAVLRSDDGRNTVIRPLVYVSEDVLHSYAQVRDFPIVQCGCPSCGLPAQKRQVVKRMLAKLDAENPGLKRNALAALGRVVPSHLLDSSVARQVAPKRDESVERAS